jgi:transcription elongation factor SPT6
MTRRRYERYASFHILTEPEKPSRRCMLTNPQEGEGWVVDEDEEDDGLSRRERRKKKRKKSRDDGALDEEDLDLIGLDVVPQDSAPPSKYKRLKRGHGARPTKSHDVKDIFADDAEDVDIGRTNNEFADFIEEEFEDDIDDVDEHEVGQPGIGARGPFQASGMDEGTNEDYTAAFGDGTDYDWAIGMQEEADAEQEGAGKELQLKDVFEPSQLVERMLTDEDNVIRETDVPERLQLARKPFKDIELAPDAMEARLNEEATWVSNLIWPKKGMEPFFEQPFQKAVRKVLEFLNLEDYEVPFIFNHRKDYLIHAPTDTDDDQDNPVPRTTRPERLLVQTDLWEILDLDLKFRAFTEKRDALEHSYENLKSIYPDISDDVIEDLIGKAVTIEEIQELQDYLHFRFSQEMGDVRQEIASNGAQKRANNARNFYNKLRNPKAISMMSAFGIDSDNFAKRAEGATSGNHLIEDPNIQPEELADQLAEYPETGHTLLRAAKLLFTQELQTNPRLRRFLRGSFYQNALIDCIRTEKGMRKITEDHAYYEFKYSRKQTFMDLHGRPELFLKMLKAEEEGLIQVRIRMDNYDNFKRKLHNHIVSDNVSEVSEQWNSLRKELLDTAVDKLHGIIAAGVKETLRARCEDELASRARDSYYNKLDQAPYKPKNAENGFIPNVIVLSHGKGQRGDAIMWAYVHQDGRVLENGKFIEFRRGNQERGIPDGKDIEEFVRICNRRKPDVVGICGFSVETRKLYRDLQDIVQENSLTGPDYEDDDGSEKSDPLDVVMVNDEVARLYYNSARAAVEFPKYPPLTRYCIALGRYLQNPMAEYASLGRDIVSLPFVPNQTLVPQDKLLDRLENAMVDMVNLVGLSLIDSYDDPYLSKLLPYICGLGPRKADKVVKAIQANGDEVHKRFDLLGISEEEVRELKAAMGPKVFQNAASFLWLHFESHDERSDYLDNTRVHPEDYDLARKMVADAMNLDEEDIKAEVEEGGPSAIIRRMVREDNTEAVHDLILEDYASEIEKKIGSRKRATLETIRAELSDPYEEIRQRFASLTSDEMFTILTGETEQSLAEGMVVPVQIKRTFPDHIEVRLECGIEGGVSESEFPEGVGQDRQAPRDVFQPHQSVRAKIVFLNRKQLTAQLSLREDIIRQLGRPAARLSGDWDNEQEAADRKAAEREKEVASGRPNRVVNHPLFFSFNAAQAEEYLGSKELGEVVIRPSSKGFDHLAVTWKVSDNAFQHIDVLEMNKASEYSLGKQLRIEKAVYSDLDELIVNHVEAMAKKVTEIMKDDRFQKGTKEETGKSPLLEYMYSIETNFKPQNNGSTTIAKPTRPVSCTPFAVSPSIPATSGSSSKLVRIFILHTLGL